MSILLPLLLAISPGSPEAAVTEGASPTPPAVEATAGPIARDLMPVFVTYCMKPGLGPTDVADHLTSLGVPAITDPRPDSLWLHSINNNIHPINFRTKS